MNLSDDDGRPVEDLNAVDFVCDFGSELGWSVGQACPDVAANIREGGENSWEYSVVPKEGAEIVQVGDLRCVLLHSRYSLIP